MSAVVHEFPSARVPKPRTLPLGDALQSTIVRLKEIAAQSGGALLTEGYVHPDHVLLDLCGDALHLIHAAEARAKRETIVRIPCLGHPDRAEYDRCQEEERAPARQAVTLLRRAKKIKATTAAGVFAKALIVRASRTGATELAMTLAEDLIDCPGLRASLWPAEAQT